MIVTEFFFYVLYTVHIVVFGRGESNIIGILIYPIFLRELHFYIWKVFKCMVKLFMLLAMNCTSHFQFIAVDIFVISFLFISSSLTIVMEEIQSRRYMTGIKREKDQNMMKGIV
jgi:hypothetical protein